MNRKKILIVDDNEVILRTLSLKLKAAGYEIITAKEGSDAVSAIRLKKPDLILLDISFPADFSSVPWDGFRIIQWLRRTEEAKNVPIMIITAGDVEKFKDKALAEGAVAFFQKPINNDELLSTIGKHIGPGQPAAPVSAGAPK